MRFFFSVFIFLGTLGVAAAKDIQISVPGYSAEIGIYEPAGASRKIAIIALHGKVGGRYHVGNVSLARQLSKAGYTVYTPQMPWYDYSASLSSAFSFLDQLVTQAAKDGKQVVILGHSVGATIGFLYTTAHTPPPQVMGNVILAPGHIIHRSRDIQAATARDVARAKELVAQGQGQTKLSFTDFNQGQKLGIRTTPEIYLSYFALDSFPNFLAFITQARVPVLWVDGDEDRVAKRMDSAGIYATIRPHDANHYTSVAGGHVSMWSNAAEPVVRWLERFSRP